MAEQGGGADIFGIANWYGEAIAAMQAGQGPRATKRIDALIKRFPDNIRFRLTKAQIAFKRGNLLGAKQQLEALYIQRPE